MAGKIALKMLRQQDTVEALRRDLERRVTNMVECRHDYPMWPLHGDYFIDAYEREYHEPIRHEYYRQTLFLVRVLKVLRAIR